jgi:ergot alkaloid biosynthesis protein
MTVLVTGATGKTGRRLVAQLRAANIDVRAASRHGEVRYDWTARDTWDAALDGVRAAYLVAPTVGDPVALVTDFVQAATARGVARFVLLSASVFEAGGFGMGQVHAYLRDHAKEWAVLRPSWFMQNFSEGTHHKAIVEEGAVYSATGDGRVPFIDAGDIAACAAACLTRAEAPNADFVLTSARPISYDEVAAAIGAAIGRPIVHRRISIAELAERHKAAGVQPFTAQGLAVMDGAIANGIEDRTTNAVETLAGRFPTRFDDFVRASVEAWRAQV